jgi:lipoprotein-releasing system permease protein
MGFTPRDILMLFFNQGLLLGLLGGVIGLMVGFGLSHIIGAIKIDAGRALNSSNQMIISYDYWIYIKAWVIALLSSVFSALWPSFEAGRLEPMDIIREGG